MAQIEMIIMANIWTKLEAGCIDMNKLSTRFAAVVYFNESNNDNKMRMKHIL